MKEVSEVVKRVPLGDKTGLIRMHHFIHDESLSFSPGQYLWVCVSQRLPLNVSFSNDRISE